MALALLPATALGAPRKVVIGPADFDPLVLVIAPGTDVEWRNDDAREHALRGDFSVDPIAPGRTGIHHFARRGRFDYHDRDNTAMEGTIIVAARGGRRPSYPPPPAVRGNEIVEHHWRATLRMDLREQWKYYDGKFRSFDGRCNAEVGEGSRLVTFAATFPDFKYVHTATAEVATGDSRAYAIQRYRERIEAKTSNPSSQRPTIDCGDGSMDVPPEIEQHCSHDYSGRRVRATLGWLPGAGRLAWSHRYLADEPGFDANCGASFLSFLKPDTLPFDPGGGNPLLYDAGRTGFLTPGDVRALRRGRSLTVTRSLELHFTKDCCFEWHEPDKEGTYVRAGAHFDVFGKVTINLRPR